LSSLFRTPVFALLVGLALAGAPLRAQGTAKDEVPKLDLAVSFTAERSIKANTTQDFWLEGGSIELGANVWHGVGIAASIRGTHSGSIGSSGIPISLVTVTFGPRYRWHADHKLSAFGQGLVGEANGFSSFFPTPAGGQSDANGLATELGGGLDYRLSNRFAARVLEVAWARTQLPNATDNTQNNLRVGAGFVLRFGR
jgi:outer membrane immunogenic protein